MSQSLEEKQQQIDRKFAIDALWRKGIVHWKLDKNQQQMMDFVENKDDQIIVIASSRQIGKSFFLCAYALQKAMQTPNTTIKYVAPKIKDIKNVVLNHIREITKDCPKDLKPKYKTNDSIFYFPNGSMIQLAATENGHIDGIRGTMAHLCIIDEAGFCSDLDYALNSVLLPTTTMTNGKIIVASTPARSPDHDFVNIMKLADIENRLIKKTIYDNPRLDLNAIDKIIAACGGVNTVQFRREYLAQNIINEDDAVIPEFNPEQEAKLVQEWKRPSHFDAYVSMDIGGSDFTAILFGYYDFLQNKLIIQDELIFKGKEIISDNIAYQIKQKEELLWRNPMTGETKTPYLRISDNNNIILLNDLGIKHSLNFIPTLKDNKQAALNTVRLMIKTEQIMIDPKCKTLINHLKSATWNKARTEYTRSPDKGHYDTIDALIYLCRNIVFSKNPYPENFKYGGNKDIFYQEQSKATTVFEQKMEQQFKITKINRRFRRF